MGICRFIENQFRRESSKKVALFRVEGDGVSRVNRKIYILKTSRKRQIAKCPTKESRLRKSFLD